MSSITILSFLLNWLTIISPTIEINGINFIRVLLLVLIPFHPPAFGIAAAVTSITAYCFPGNYLGTYYLSAEPIYCPVRYFGQRNQEIKAVDFIIGDSLHYWYILFFFIFGVYFFNLLYFAASGLLLGYWNAKMGVHSRAEAIRICVREHLL
ncbi:hypothetical protein [Bifidobacterium biavatii]|uniref:hypothetical protein n=1 Tax=Bifidobacterium biavatii TaxID=762212 RepID=UPI0012698C68|nr:hypothetical protein [Bifidobacterium biavatii]